MLTNDLLIISTQCSIVEMKQCFHVYVKAGIDQSFEPVCGEMCAVCLCIRVCNNGTSLKFNRRGALFDFFFFFFEKIGYKQIQ